MGNQIVLKSLEMNFTSLLSYLYSSLVLLSKAVRQFLKLLQLYFPLFSSYVRIHALIKIFYMCIKHSHGHSLPSCSYVAVFSISCSAVFFLPTAYYVRGRYQHFYPHFEAMLLFLCLNFYCPYFKLYLLLHQKYYLDFITVIEFFRFCLVISKS